MEAVKMEENEKLSWMNERMNSLSWNKKNLVPGLEVSTLETCLAAALLTVPG